MAMSSFGAFVATPKTRQHGFEITICRRSAQAFAQAAAGRRGSAASEGGQPLQM